MPIAPPPPERSHASGDIAATRILALLNDATSESGISGQRLMQRVADLLQNQSSLDQQTSGAWVPRRGLATWQVKRVTAYMRERLEHEIGLNELAALVDLSRFHFCTAFRMATGRTPHEWLTHERMARAKSLLAESRMRVTDIALSVGYGTPSAFAAAFRKVVGQTPTEFRRWL